MRKLLAFLSLALICSGTLRAQSETIEGNGKIVSADVPVKAFETLKASGVFQLRLVQGSTESVKVEADENLQALIHVRNEGNQLVIDMGKKKKNYNLKRHNHMVVYVTFRQLKSLELSMLGNVSGEGELSFDKLQIRNKSVGNVSLKLNASRIELDNESVGNVSLSGRATTALFRNEGVGNLKAGDLKAQTVSVINEGVGNAEVHADKDLQVKDSFLGKVRNRGAAKVRSKEVI